MRPEQTISVLLLEDNPDDVRLIDEALSTLPQLRLRHAESLAEALAEVTSEPPDLILLDLSESQAQGLETLAKLRDSAPRCPVVALTSREDEELALSALRAGVQDCLVKSQFAGPDVRRSVAGLLLYALERSRTEAALQQSHNLLRAVIHGISGAVFVKDAAGRYLLLNEAASRLVGKPADDVLGQDDTSVFDADGARIGMDRDRRVMETGREETEEEELTADGLPRVYLTTKAPFRDERGEIIGTIGFSHDITARKQAEEAQRAERDRFARIVSVTPGAIHTLCRRADGTFCLPYASPRIVDIFGLPPEELAADLAPALARSTRRMPVG